MLKKHIKVIEKLIANRKSSFASKCPVNADFNGKYLYSDAFRFVVIDEKLDIATENCNCDMIRFAQDTLSKFKKETEVAIPYTTSQIRKYAKQDNPFYMGVSTGKIIRCTNVGIDPKFLADAMETTKSNVVQIDEKGRMIIQGNGFKWYILPIIRETLCQEMTAIGEN